jgi:predicted nucleic acid-binding protein
VIFADTSALYALLDRDDENHVRAKATWERLLDSGVEPFTTNYVGIESCALAQRRLGMAAVRTLLNEMLPIMRVVWMSESLHQLAVAGLLAAGRRQLSLVDCASFAVLRAEGQREAFAFDRHFQEEGFRLL